MSVVGDFLFLGNEGFLKRRSLDSVVVSLILRNVNYVNCFESISATTTLLKP